jgi:hypothetical protein
VIPVLPFMRSLGPSRVFSRASSSFSCDVRCHRSVCSSCS